MGGFLSAFLCCGADARDDGDENNYNNSSPKRGSGEPSAQRKTNGKVDDAKKADDNTKATEDTFIGDNKKRTKARESKLDYDDNSVNETDTIAYTNEDNNTPTTANHDSTHNGGPKTEDTPQDPVIIANQNGDEDVVDIDLEELDEESLADLTKFQEGQYRNSQSGWLLGPKDEALYKNKKCLILDLDETLVHSSFKYLRTADFVIPVEIDNQVHHVYVIKRPGVDEFLKRVGEWYEVVVFTASVAKYGDPLLDKLDIHHSVHHRLFRDSCFNYQGNFIKNLSQIGRPLSECIIIDNSPASYIFHPQHSIPISSWFSDTHDNELLDLLPFLEDLSKTNVDDVSLVLDIMI